MKENLGALKSANSLKSEHLIKGVKPIMACVGSYGDYGISEEETFLKEHFDKPSDDVHNIDYYDDVFTNANKNFLGGGRTWTISIIDNLNKFSEKFFNCTGLIVTGKDKVTGKNISFLSHQDPNKFLSWKMGDFIDHLRQRLKEIQNRCEKGTIDTVIIGGSYPATGISSMYSNLPRQNYLDSIKLLSLEVEQVLGFEPVVINGPKMECSAYNDYDTVYFDNENRRLYFVRPKVNPDTGSFTQTSIDKEKKKWEHK